MISNSPIRWTDPVTDGIPIFERPANSLKICYCLLHLPTERKTLPKKSCDHRNFDKD